MENVAIWHGQAPNDEEMKNATIAGDIEIR
jgi:hypothetical protein